MNVTGDRVVDHGSGNDRLRRRRGRPAAVRRSARRDSGRVPARTARWPAEKGFGRSNGCAFADSPGHIPMQRMANVSLQPAPDGPTHRRADLRRRAAASTSSATSRGRSTCSGTTSSSPGSGSSGSRTAGWPASSRTWRTRPRRPTSGGRWRRSANAETYVLGGAFNCGKGQPGQIAPVSHGCPSALFRRRQRA